MLLSKALLNVWEITSDAKVIYPGCLNPLSGLYVAQIPLQIPVCLEASLLLQPRRNLHISSLQAPTSLAPYLREESLLPHRQGPSILVPARLTLETPIPLAEDAEHGLTVKAQIIQSQ